MLLVLESFIIGAKYDCRRSKSNWIIELTLLWLTHGLRFCEDDCTRVQTRLGISHHHARP